MWLNAPNFLAATNFRLIIPFIVVLTITTILLISRRKSSKVADIKLINQPKWYDVVGLQAKLTFVLNARKLLAKGSSSERPFRLLTDLGEMIVLPAKYASEIRSDPRLSFARVIEDNFHARLSGFEGFRQGTTDAHFSRDVANNQLTHSLAKVTEALSAEAEAALEDLFPSSGEWSEYILRDKILHLVARLSARVFLGAEGAHNNAWLTITTEYTKTAYIAAYLVRLWPHGLRPFAAWFLPPCRKLRAHVAQARRIIDDVVNKRREAKLSGTETEYNDAIEWFDQDTKERTDRYDPVVAQLILAQAAIETTTDLLTQTILDIAQNPVLIDPLRSEIDDVLSKGGWKKSSLYDMKLLDSVLKESQRLKPLAMTSMHRLVTADVTLSDGIRLPMGSTIGVSGDRMWSADVHEDPAHFDGYRFYNQRNLKGTAGNLAHFVSTSVDHLAFGYGKNACAGRFFVAHEAKIALSHVLLKYDWKLATSAADAKPMEFGLTMIANPKAKISIRARERGELNGAAT